MRTGRRGIALLLVVWLLALLAVISAEFVFSSRVQMAAERNSRDALQGYALAHAGYRAAIAALDGKLANLSRDEAGGLLLHYPGREEGVAARVDEVPLGEGTYSYRIEDEEGKINVNNPGLGRQTITDLLRECGMEIGADRDTAVDSLLDWRDANRNHRLNGAEEDYYRSLDPPYSCKDGPLDVPEELRLVRGITSRCFLGGEEGGRTLPGLRDLVTTLGESVVEVNPNTAPDAVLAVLRRERPPQPPRPPRISAHFSILASGRARAGAAERSIRAVVQRDAEGDKTRFQLLYWNDDPGPVTTEKGVASELLSGHQR
jgi:general secretion pathway protein K